MKCATVVGRGRTADVMSSNDQKTHGLGTERLSTARSTGPWQLELSSGAHTERKIFAGGEVIVLGTGPGASVRVDDPAVSARHVMLRATKSGVLLRDLDSTNGVYVAGARVQEALLTGVAVSFVIGRTAVSVCPMSETEDDGDDAQIDGLVGRSAPMRQLAREIRRFAPLSAAVLLCGESGTGKDVVASALHRLGERPGRLVALNVGGLSETLADSELFGHSKGAFTGALCARDGAFREADKGSLFLDEIGELDAAIQVKLLRVIEDQAVRPLGANGVHKVNVRVISATCAPLEERIATGEFRHDLLYRIATVRLTVPPLRKRLSDIPALAEYWLRRHEAELGEKRLTGPAIARLLAHRWYGNVRELGSVLYRAAVEAGPRSVSVDARHVDLALPQTAVSTAPRDRCAEARRLLEAHHGNVSAAARAAKVPRTTFRTWLKASSGAEDAA